MDRGKDESVISTSMSLRVEKVKGILRLTLVVSMSITLLRAFLITFALNSFSFI